MRYHPDPAKFLNIPVGPTSAPIASALLPEAVETAFSKMKSFIQSNTSKYRQLYAPLLSEEKRPAELPL